MRYSLMKIGQPCFLPSCQRALPFIAHSSSSRGTSSDLGQKPIKRKQTTIAYFVVRQIKSNTGTIQSEERELEVPSTWKELMQYL